VDIGHGVNKYEGGRGAEINSGGLLLICLLSLFVGTAGAVSLPACQDLILTIPNKALGLGTNVVSAPKLRLSRSGHVYPLKVTRFLSGVNGEVVCNVPSGLGAGHYSLWVVKNGKWVRVYTLVKVFAPSADTVTVAGSAIQSTSQVTLGGLFSAKHLLSPLTTKTAKARR